MPPHDAIRLEELNELAEQLPTPYLLLGDFNGHSTWWGSDDTNSRGRQIEQFITDNCLCLLNTDEKTYFHEPTRTFHSVDLAICSPSLLPLFNLTVGNDLYNSDHYPLAVSQTGGSSVRQRPPTYVYSRADWALFTQRAVISETVINIENIDEAVKNVTETIGSAADLAIPKNSSNPHRHYKP